jgi:hypothetical protein
VHVQIFREDLLAKSIIDPNVVCELMDCSATVFVDELSISSTFPVGLLVLGRPERSSFSADTRPDLESEYHSKITARLKECSPKPSRRI